jgi:hypothetical protein
MQLVQKNAMQAELNLSGCELITIDEVSICRLLMMDVFIYKVVFYYLQYSGRWCQLCKRLI